MSLMDKVFSLCKFHMPHKELLNSYLGSLHTLIFQTSLLITLFTEWSYNILMTGNICLSNKESSSCVYSLCRPCKYCSMMKHCHTKTNISLTRAQCCLVYWDDSLAFNGGLMVFQELLYFWSVLITTGLLQY